jgi:hypothetical protein
MSDAIQKTETLRELEKADPSLPKKLAKAVTDKALDRALGDDVSPEIKREIAAKIAPWAERLAYLLDDWIRIPGTDIKFGLDAIVGLIPGVGDVVTGTGSVALLLLALKNRVPTAGLLRMIGNIGVDVVGGAIPFVGDLFDVAWRSNRKNLEIIKRYEADPDAEASTGDKVLVGVGITLAVLGVLVPFAIGIWLGAGVFAIFS